MALEREIEEVQELLETGSGESNVWARAETVRLQLLLKKNKKTMVTVKVKINIEIQEIKRISLILRLKKIHHTTKESGLQCCKSQKSNQRSGNNYSKMI